MDTEVRYDTCACGKRMSVGSYQCAYCEAASFADHASKCDIKNWVRVDYCPDDEFPRGARFSGTEFDLTPTSARNGIETTLRLGYWTPGMIVTDWLGRTWEVIGCECEPQSLRRVNGNGSDATQSVPAARDEVCQVRQGVRA